MRYSFLIDVDPEEIFGSEVSDEVIEKWYRTHKEEFILNLYEHARDELKYYGTILYPLEEERLDTL